MKKDNQNTSLVMLVFLTISMIRSIIGQFQKTNMVHNRNIVYSCPICFSPDLLSNLDIIFIKTSVEMKFAVVLMIVVLATGECYGCTVEF